MTSKWAFLVTIILLLIVGGGVCSAAPAPDQEFSVEQLYEQVEVLRWAGELQLTDEQIGQIIPLVQNLNQRHEELLSWADSEWEQHESPIQQLLAAAIAGRPAPAEASQAARQAIADLTRERQAFTNAADTAADSFVALLSSSQRQLVTDRQEAQHQAQMARELAGAASLPEYVVQFVDIQRHLLPDEYELLRTVQAEQLAARIVDPRAGGFGAVVQRVLSLTDGIFGWDQGEYNQRYPTLAQEVVEYLQLPELPAAKLISYQDLTDLLTSPYTVPLLQRMAANPEPESLPTEVRRISDHALSQVLEYLQFVSLLNDLQLAPVQLAALVPVVQQIWNIAQPVRAPFASHKEALKSTLEQACQLLLATGQQSPELAKYEATMQQTRHQVRLRIASYLGQVADILTPVQNDLIDWRPPADIMAVDTEQLLRQQRQLLAEMENALAFLERMLYRDDDIYRQTRVWAVTEFLSRYIDPDAPIFSDYLYFSIGLMNRVHRGSRARWPYVRAELTVEFMRGIGALADPGQPPVPDKPLGWEDMYTLVTHPEAPSLIQQMLAARTGGQ